MNESQAATALLLQCAGEEAHDTEAEHEIGILLIGSLFVLVLVAGLKAVQDGLGCIFGRKKRKETD